MVNKTKEDYLKMELKDKINFIIDQEKQANNSWNRKTKLDYINNHASKKTINDLFRYWTLEENPFKKGK